MSDIAISVQNVSKAYRIGQKEEIPDTLVDAAVSTMKMPLRNFRRLSRLDTFRENGESDDIMWALKDVSFDVKQGEVVGVIGRNGAGKSTLLKILSRITEPTSGRAVIHGRVSSLLEVGTGFHPELTGRENIYMNGTILGMKKREIDAKFDEIVDFSGVEKFLDTPVKRYSSGMKVRLAFSVAAHLEPEILIIDEVLAVGDAEFQKKCIGKMESVARRGRTVLFVSHNMAAVESLCSMGIVLQDGSVRMCGDVRTAIDGYVVGGPSGACGQACLCDHPGRSSAHRTIMRHCRVKRRAEGECTGHIRMGGTLVVEVEYETAAATPTPVLGIVIKTSHSSPVFGINNRITGITLRAGTVGSATISCTIDNLPLMPGRYLVDLYFGDQNSDSDIVIDAMDLFVEPSDVYGTGRLPPANCGPIYLNASWRITDLAR